MFITKSIRFETPSRKLYRFQIVQNIHHSPDRPGVYGVFMPQQPTQTQATPLLWGLVDSSFLDLAETNLVTEPKDPRLKPALSVKESFFAVLLVDGFKGRRVIMEDLAQTRTVYEPMEYDTEVVDRSEGPPPFSRNMPATRARANLAQGRRHRARA